MTPPAFPSLTGPRVWARSLLSFAAGEALWYTTAANIIPQPDNREVEVEARLPLAVAAGKMVGVLSQYLNVGGGTTYPGEIARRIDPHALAKMAARLKHRSIVITGTNGKTTTSRMVSNVLRSAGLRPVHNRAGANLITGVTSAVLRSVDLLGRPRADIGLFEVDEAMFPSVVAEVQPRVMVMTNLFRDQLDRYGEVDYLARIWRDVLQKLVPDPVRVPGLEATVALNADDPTVANLGRHINIPVLYFGLDDERYGSPGLQHTADVRYCPDCGNPLVYPLCYYGHVGKYHCTECGFSRPIPHISARLVTLGGVDGSTCEIETPRGPLTLRVRVPGIYNVYNTLAAVAGSIALDVPTESIIAGVESLSAAFGRAEAVQIGDKKAFLALVKNPVGFNEVLRTLFSDQTVRPAMIIINDNIADGTDISWLWDVDFEILPGKVSSVVVSGTRAEDMAMRLKYAGVDPAQVPIDIEKDLWTALQSALARIPPGDTLYVLPTYTAMLELRDVLQKRGYVGRFWQD